jgi:hypothetical protein
MSRKNNSQFSDVEEDLLKSIALFDKEPEDEAFDPEEESEEDLGDSDDIDSAAEDSADGKQRGDADSEKRDADAGKAPTEREQQQRSQSNPTRNGITTDKQGNLIGPDGKIVAKAGTERRLYETTTHLKRTVAQKDQQLQTMQQQMKAFGEIAVEIKSLNLGHQDTIQAMRLWKEFQSKPEVVMKELLAEYQALGYNLNTLIGGDDRSAMDMKAIQTMIDKATAPMRQTTEQSQREFQIRQQVEQETQDFFDRYPDAVHHENDIAKLMLEGNMNPREAYITLKEWAANNGLNFNEPLEPQWEARKAGANARQQEPRTADKPRVTGRGAVNQRTAKAAKTYELDASYAEIIRDSMAEAGFAV